MSYIYQSSIFSGKAYLKVEDVRCLCKLKKEKFDKLQKKFDKLLKVRNEEVALAAKRIVAERKEKDDNMVERNELEAKYELLKEKYGYESESESESESEEEEEVVVKPIVLSELD